MQQIMGIVKPSIYFTIVILGSVHFLEIHQFGFRHLEKNLSLSIKYMEKPVLVNRICDPTQEPSTTTEDTIIPTPKCGLNQCDLNLELDYGDPRQAVNKNPVSRLYEIQAKIHGKAPIFKEIGERGQQNSLEFHVQVIIDCKVACAWGHTKKDAKRRAAIKMLALMDLPVYAAGNNINIILESC